MNLILYKFSEKFLSFRLLSSFSRIHIFKSNAFSASWVYGFSYRFYIRNFF